MSDPLLLMVMVYFIYPAPFANIMPHMQAEDQRNRGKEGGRLASNGNDSSANGDDGGAPRGEAFRLSSRGRRDGGGLAVHQGACCA